MSATSGRVSHAEKITVYLTEQEYVALQAARLALHREHVDRGRIVREAITGALADLPSLAERLRS